MSKKERLGEILIRKGLVTKEDIDAAFKLQVGGYRRMGYLLIKMKKITSDELIHALSDQLDIPIVSVRDHFSEDIKRILPRHMCRKYSVIPLSRDQDNVLTLAMVDPLDYEAISHIETYTDYAVRQVIANENEISRAIGKNIPLSRKDIFNPRIFKKISKGIAGILVFSMLAIGFFLYFQVSKEKYGDLTVSESSQIYRNHDLEVTETSDDLITFRGKGAYSPGSFSVTFQDLKQFRLFLQQKRNKFSEEQFNWLMWLAKNRLGMKSKNS